MHPAPKETTQAAEESGVANELDDPVTMPAGLIGAGLLGMVSALAYGMIAMTTLRGPTAFDPLGELGGPLGLAVLLGVFAVLALFQGIRRWRAAPANALPIFSRGDLYHIIILAALLVGYGLALRWIGFLISTLPFTALILWTSGYRNWPVIVCLGIGVTGIVWFVFQNVLGVHLP